MKLSRIAFRISVSMGAVLLLGSCAGAHSGAPAAPVAASATPEEPDCYVQQTEEEATAELEKLDAAYDADRDAAWAAVHSVNERYPDVASTVSIDQSRGVLTVTYFSGAPRDRLDNYLAEIQPIVDSSSYPLDLAPRSYAEAPLQALLERLARGSRSWADGLGGTVTTLEISPEQDGSIWVGLLEGAPEAFSIEVEGTTVHVSAEPAPRVVVDIGIGSDDPPPCASVDEPETSGVLP